MTALQLIRDALARIVRAREAFEIGDQALAFEILRDLEADLAGEADRQEPPTRWAA